MNFVEGQGATRKGPAALTVLVLLACTMGTVMGQGTGAEFRFGPGNQGALDTEVPEQAHILWTFKADRKIESSPVIANNLVYFGSADGKVYALDPLNGKEVWNFTTQGEVAATPTIDGTEAYFGASDRRFYSVDALSGDELWNVTLQGPLARVTASAKIWGTNAFVGDMDGKFYSINLTNHKIEWVYDTGNDTIRYEFWGSAAISWPYVYVGTAAYVSTGEGGLFCLDARDGERVWSKNVPGMEGIFASPTIVGDRVMIGSGLGDETVYCLNATTGDIIWYFDVAGPVYGTIAHKDGVLFVTAWASVDPVIERPSYLMALPLEEPVPVDGVLTFSDIIWQAETHEGEGGSSPLVADGKVIVGSAGGHVWCFNETTGVEVWHMETSSGIVSSPIANNHIVYIGSGDGMLYAISGSVADTIVEIVPESPTVKGGRVLGIRFKVTYRGVPITGALVSVSASDGKMSQGSATTFPDGTQRIKFIAPDVSSEKEVTINVNVTKLGFPSTDNTTVVRVLPSTSYTGVSAGDIEFSIGSYLIELIMILVLVIINIVVLALTQRKRKGPKPPVKVQPAVPPPAHVPGGGQE